jgi:3-oxoacyl-[acyl-carrier protein] reductase
MIKPMDLSGKLALVTRGSRGNGRAIAIAMTDAGADVAVDYKENKSDRRTGHCDDL